MAKKAKKYSPAKLHVFQPKDNIDPRLILELTDIIRIGVAGDTLEKMSEELQDHFIELDVA